MKNRFRLKHRCDRSALAALAFAIVLCLAPAAMSQNLPEPLAPPTSPAEMESFLNQVYPEENNSAIPPADGAESKPWKVEPRVTLSEVYDSNIFISPQNRRGDFLFTFSPGLNAGIGDFKDQRENFLLLDYAASAVRFAKYQSEDAIEQQGALSMQYKLAKLTLGLQLHFQDLSDTDLDVGNRTRRRLYQTALLTSYEFSDKTYLETNLYNNISDYTNLLSSSEWSVRSSLNYRWTPKFTSGFGGTLGQLNVQESGVQTFERALVKTIYQATEKVLLSCDGGGELRQFQNAPERFSPVFDIMATYRPFEATELSLSTYRRTQNSAAFVGQDYTLTGVSLEVRRDVWNRFKLVAAGGYQNAAYLTDNTAKAQDGSSREDHYFFARPSLRYNIRDGCHLEIFYMFRQNDSNGAAYAFVDSQAGVQFTLSY